MVDYIVSSPQYSVTIPSVSTSTNGLMTSEDKKKLDSLSSIGNTSLPSYKVQTGSQVFDGPPPDSERVQVTGTCKSINLLCVSAGIHAQVFLNATNHAVKFTSVEQIVSYPEGFILSPGDAVNFVRDPVTDSWRVW